MKTILALTLLVTSSIALASPNTYKLSCGGTEPFWDANVSSDEILFNNPVLDKKVPYWDLKTIESAGMAAGFAFEITATRLKGKEKIRLSVINAGQEGCSDGMSDQVYKYHVLANVNGAVFYGCCNESK